MPGFVLSALHTVGHSILPVVLLQSRHNYPQFTNEEARALSKPVRSWPEVGTKSLWLEARPLAAPVCCSHLSFMKTRPAAGKTTCHLAPVFLYFGGFWSQPGLLCFSFRFFKFLCWPHFDVVTILCWNVLIPSKPICPLFFLVWKIVYRLRGTLHNLHTLILCWFC